MERALPIIDLGEGSEEGAAPALLAEEIGIACRDVGFFYVVNHGVERTLMNEAFAQSHRFFALPLAEKEAIAIETVGGNRGYSGLMHEALDPTRGPDRKEAFNVGFDLAPDDPELVAGKPFRSLNAWPQLPGFRETLLAYYDACAGLGARLHRALARDLGVQPAYFTDKFDRPMATLRLLRYPAAEPRRGRKDRRGNAYRLRQPDTARDRRRRRPRGAHARRRMDRGPRPARRLRRQYRRLPDALDERRLRFDPSPRRQPQRPRALLDRLLLRPQPRRGGRGYPVTASRPANPSATRRCWRPTISSSGSTPASRRPPAEGRTRAAWFRLEVTLRTGRRSLRSRGSSPQPKPASVAFSSHQPLRARETSAPSASTSSTSRGISPSA